MNCYIIGFAGNFKLQEMCNDAVRMIPEMLEFVPDHFKTQKMCNEAIYMNPYSLPCVLDWLVTQGQVKSWHDDDDYLDDDETIEWYDGSKKTQGPEGKN